MSGEVWVMAETARGDLREETLEAVCEARGAAQTLNARLAAVLLGESPAGRAGRLAAHGADRVYWLDHPALARYHPELCLAALLPLIAEHRPSAICLSDTPDGRDLAARLAARLRVRLVSRVSRMHVKPDGLLELERPVCGGRFAQTFLAAPGGPILLTLLSGIGLDRPDPSRQAELVRATPELDGVQPRLRILGEYRVNPEAIPLTEAEVIVAGGRGVGSREGWRMIEALAGVLGGAVAGSRMAVDAGWIPRERMVGQTGVAVKPRVYVAAGISGASQHVAGMKDAKTVIAINQDRRAPIFNVANLDVVGDLGEILPPLVARLREVTGTGGV